MPLWNYNQFTLAHIREHRTVVRDWVSLVDLHDCLQGQRGEPGMTAKWIRRHSVLACMVLLHLRKTVTPSCTIGTSLLMRWRCDWEVVWDVGSKFDILKKPWRSLQEQCLKQATLRVKRMPINKTGQSTRDKDMLWLVKHSHCSGASLKQQKNSVVRPNWIINAKGTMLRFDCW